MVSISQKQVKSTYKMGLFELFVELMLDINNCYESVTLLNIPLNYSGIEF